MHKGITDRPIVYHCGCYSCREDWKKESRIHHKWCRRQAKKEIKQQLKEMDYGDYTQELP